MINSSEINFRIEIIFFMIPPFLSLHVCKDLRQRPVESHICFAVTHTVMLSSHASELSPAVTHSTHNTQQACTVHTHYHAGRCLRPAALCMELRGARPAECEREAQERATLSDTCQRSHTTSPRTQNTQHNVRTHTHRSVT